MSRNTDETKRRREIVSWLRDACHRISRPDPGRRFIGKLQRESAVYCIEQAMKLLRRPTPPKRKHR